MPNQPSMAISSSDISIGKVFKVYNGCYENKERKFLGKLNPKFQGYVSSPIFSKESQSNKWTMRKGASVPSPSNIGKISFVVVFLLFPLYLV